MTSVQFRYQNNFTITIKMGNAKIFYILASAVSGVCFLTARRETLSLSLWEWILSKMMLWEYSHLIYFFCILVLYIHKREPNVKRFRSSL